jgi:hypothetical protein
MIPAPGTASDGSYWTVIGNENVVGMPLKVSACGANVTVAASGGRGRERGANAERGHHQETAHSNLS